MFNLAGPGNLEGILSSAACSTIARHIVHNPIATSAEAKTPVTLSANLAVSSYSTVTLYAFPDADASDLLACHGS
jgi:hypothetical protein